jgi:hypothetical protein
LCQGPGTEDDEDVVCLRSAKLSKAHMLFYVVSTSFHILVSLKPIQGGLELLKKVKLIALRRGVPIFLHRPLPSLCMRNFCAWSGTSEAYKPRISSHPRRIYLRQALPADRPWQVSPHTIPMRSRQRPWKPLAASTFRLSNRC